MGSTDVAVMAIGDSRTDAEGAGLDEWVLHAGDLLLHGLQRFANHRRTHALGAKVADLLELE